MDSTLKTTPCTETRERLLEAAGEVFAEHGFRNATIRDICQRANANIAAVNYHFGDKLRLYTEVLRHAQRTAIELHPPDMGLGPDATPEERLHAFIRSLLLRTLDGSQPAWHGRLLSREMIEPTPALDALVEEEFRPRAQMLNAIVRDLLGGEPSEETVRLCALSTVGQAHFHHHSRAVIDRLYPEQQYGPEDIERLADHLTRFAIAALRSFGAGESRKGQSRREVVTR